MNFWRHFLCSKVADGLQIYHWNTEEVLEDSDEVSSVLRSFCFISHSTFGIPSCMNYCKLFSIYVFYEKLFKLKQNYPTSEKLTLKYYQYCMIFSVLKPNKIGQLLMAEIKNSLKEDFTGKTSFKLKTFRSLLYEINVFDKVFEISIEESNYYAKILNEKKRRRSCFQVFYSIDVLTVYLQVYQKDSIMFAFLWLLLKLSEKLFSKASLSDCY